MRDGRPATAEAGQLEAVDLIPDHALGAGDVDAFGHSSIAGRLAELVASASTPLNIGLFGPWGSGKSSFCELLGRELSRRKHGRIKVIRYEAAWKFGGAALERNFISHVARALELDEDDKDNREFYRGLYERRRSADIDLGKLKESGARVAVLFTAVLLLVIAVLTAILGVTAWISDSRTMIDLVETTLPEVVASSAVVALIAALLTAILAGAHVEVEQSQPADEELAATFERLVKRILKKHDRVVFFIDELDRCSAEDVVSTLATIKNFLGHSNCVFVITADRDALEKALNKLPQETPANEEEPYYSTATAFLDKVFQHQVALPPLRTRRLTRFAQELVTAHASQGGLWAELQGHEADGKLLDDVIYALIPSHVRSPRRVKVLLNNFATNARIAQSRGIDHLARAAEIAKLTVLETEFPLVANDLHLEPRLPTAILNALDAGDTVPTEDGGEDASTRGRDRRESRVERLVVRHVRGAGDRLIGSDSTTEGVLTAARRDELRRYLQRAAAAGIPDPGGDLLYLEAAGDAVGLEDAELGEFIEQVAPDAPDDVVSRLADVEVDEQRAAARLLSHMADESVGGERASVIGALMGLCEQMGDAAAPVAGVVASALNSYLVAPAGSLDEDSLPGALVLARLAEGDDPAPLTDTLFKDERLLSTDDRVETVARQAARLPDRHLPLLYERVGANVSENWNVVLTPLADLPAEAARSLLRAESVANAVIAELKSETSEPEGSETLARELLDAVRANEAATVELETSVQWLLLRSGADPAYRVAKDNAPSLLPQISDHDLVASRVLRALEVAPPADWAGWHALLPSAFDLEGNRLARARNVISRIVTHTGGAPVEAQQAGCDLMRTLVKHIGDPAADTWESLQPTVQTALEAQAWWSSADTREKQQALHQVVRELGSPDEGVAAAVDALLRADVERGLAEQPPPRPNRTPEPPPQEAIVGAGPRDSTRSTQRATGTRRMTTRSHSRVPG